MISHQANIKSRHCQFDTSERVVTVSGKITETHDLATTAIFSIKQCCLESVCVAMYVTDDSVLHVPSTSNLVRPTSFQSCQTANRSSPKPQGLAISYTMSFYDSGHRHHTYGKYFREPCRYHRTESIPHLPFYICGQIDRGHVLPWCHGAYPFH